MVDRVHVRLAEYDDGRLGRRRSGERQRQAAPGDASVVRCCGRDPVAHGDHWVGASGCDRAHCAAVASHTGSPPWSSIYPTQRGYRHLYALRRSRSRRGRPWVGGKNPRGASACALSGGPHPPQGTIPHPRGPLSRRQRATRYKYGLLLRGRCNRIKGAVRFGAEIAHTDRVIKLTVAAPVRPRCIAPMCAGMRSRATSRGGRDNAGDQASATYHADDLPSRHPVEVPRGVLPQTAHRNGRVWWVLRTGRLRHYQGRKPAPTDDL